VNLDRILRFILVSLFVVCSTGVASDIGSIAFIPGQKTDPFYMSVYEGVKSAAEILDVNIIYGGADEWDVNLQIAELERIVKLKPSVILISPTDAKALIAPLKKANALGIKIITFDTYIDDGKYQDGTGLGDFPFVHISSDNVYGGRVAAKTLAEAIGKSGTVYIVKGSPASTTEMREYGFKVEMKRYPNIKILKTLICSEDSSLAKKQLMEVYSKNKNLNGVFGADLFSAIGAADGVKALNMSNKITVVALDATEEIANKINNGEIHSAIAQHPRAIGYYGIMCAYGLMSNEGYPLSLNTGFTVINRDNINNPSFNKFIYK
jgi:ribose transport system substrate-binding protein